MFIVNALHFFINIFILKLLIYYILYYIILVLYSIKLNEQLEFIKYIIILLSDPSNSTHETNLIEKQEYSDITN